MIKKTQRQALLFRFKQFFLAGQTEKQVWLIAITSRLAIFVLAVFFLGFNPAFGSVSFWQAFSRWDGEWYLKIIQNGYSWAGPQVQANVAFFPLYPLLGKVFSWFLIDSTLSLFLVSNLSFLAFCLVFYQLVSLVKNKKIALQSVFYINVFPLSFLFSCLYTESLFLLLVSLSFYLAYKQKWWLTGLSGYLASLTRSSGVLLFLVLVYWYLAVEKKIKKSFFPLFLVPLGTLTYMIYLHFKVGDALAFYKVLSAWKIVTVPPWVLVAETVKFLLSVPSSSYFFAIVFFDLMVICFFLFLFLSSWSKTEKPFILYNFLILMLALTKMWQPNFFYPAGSVSRYLLEAFPLFWVLAVLTQKKPWLAYTYLFFCLILFGPLALAFFKGFWVF